MDMSSYWNQRRRDEVMRNPTDLNLDFQVAQDAYTILGVSNEQIPDPRRQVAAISYLFIMMAEVMKLNAVDLMNHTDKNFINTDIPEQLQQYNALRDFINEEICKKL